MPLRVACHKASSLHVDVADLQSVCCTPEIIVFIVRRVRTRIRTEAVHRMWYNVECFVDVTKENGEVSKMSVVSTTSLHHRITCSDVYKKLEQMSLPPPPE